MTVSFDFLDTTVMNFLKFILKRLSLSKKDKRIKKKILYLEKLKAREKNRYAKKGFQHQIEILEFRLKTGKILVSKEEREDYWKIFHLVMNIVSLDEFNLFHANCKVTKGNIEYKINMLLRMSIYFQLVIGLILLGTGAYLYSFIFQDTINKSIENVLVIAFFSFSLFLFGMVLFLRAIKERKLHKMVKAEINNRQII